MELFYDPKHHDKPFGEEVHKDELYKLCENVLACCTTQRIRYTAMEVLSVLYVNAGLLDQAKAMCEQFPESIFDTVSEQYELMYARCDGEKYIEFIKKNLRFTAEHLMMAITDLRATMWDTFIV